MASYKTKNSKLIAGKRYNKTNFTKRWSEVTRKFTRELTKDDLNFIKGSLMLTSAYMRLAKDDKTRITIDERKFQKYPVRGLVLISPNSKTPIWVGKKTIINLLYPPKKRKLNQKSLVLKALRQVVEEDVQRERELQRRQMYAFAEEMECPLSGELLIDCEKTHLDHKYPFSKLAEDFFRSRGVDMQSVQVRVRGTYYLLLDKKLAEDWRSYHKAKAVLQLTCAKENIKKSNKVY